MEGPSQSSNGTQLDPMVITDPATDRYNTFSYISWWRQEVIRSATIMVIGAGALGNEVLKNLALMGVGRIFIADFDKIEDSNLSRSILYRASDNGRRKAEVAAEAVRGINPDIDVMWFHGDINHELGLGVYRYMDAVIGCLDNREARLSINRACWHLNKPWINGGIVALDGEVTVYWPNRGACYECSISADEYREISKRLSCSMLARQGFIQGKIPTTPISSSIIAAMQTQEALKILHGINVQAGRTYYFYGLSNDFFFMDRKLNPDCVSDHEIYDEITELPGMTAESTTLAELLTIAHQDLGESAFLIIPTFIERGECPFCGTTKEIMTPRFRLTVDNETCPQCGEAMRLIPVERIKGGETIVEWTMASVGIPALHIVPARNKNWVCKYYELTGDKNEFLHFAPGSD